jgi:hypothetical protein
MLLKPLALRPRTQRMTLPIVEASARRGRPVRLTRPCTLPPVILALREIGVLWSFPVISVIGR